MAKSIIEALKTPMNQVIDVSDPDEMTLRNPFGPSTARGKGTSMVDLSDPDAVTLRNPLGKKATAARAAKAAKSKPEDMSKRITEGKNINGTRIADYADVAPKKKASKPAIKKLKDTSDQYWSANGSSGEHGSASGEVGADMGKVNKGGYDADSDGMKRGGKVKKMAGGGSASSRGDGCAIRGRTKGRMV